MKGIVGIIPARYASERLPGKPLIKIGGISMIERVYEQALKSKHLNEVWVATDDSRIYDYVKIFTHKVLMTSPDHINGTSRCAEALENLENTFDYLVNIQGDEPFIDSQDIDKLCKALKNQEIATLACHLKEDDIKNKNVVKVLVDDEGNAVLFSRKNIEYKIHAQLQHIGIYGFKTEVLKKIIQLSPSPNEQLEKLEQLRWLDHGYNIKVAIVPKASLSIDTPKDLEIAEMLIKKGEISI